MRAKHDTSCHPGKDHLIAVDRGLVDSPLPPRTVLRCAFTDKLPEALEPHRLAARPPTLLVHSDSSSAFLIAGGEARPMPVEAKGTELRIRISGRPGPDEILLIASCRPWNKPLAFAEIAPPRPAHMIIMAFQGWSKGLWHTGPLAHIMHDVVLSYLPSGLPARLIVPGAPLGPFQDHARLPPGAPACFDDSGLHRTYLCLLAGLWDRVEPLLKTAQPPAVRIETGTLAEAVTTILLAQMTTSRHALQLITATPLPQWAPPWKRLAQNLGATVRTGEASPDDAPAEIKAGSLTGLFEDSAWKEVAIWLSTTSLLPKSFLRDTVRLASFTR